MIFRNLLLPQSKTLKEAIESIDAYHLLDAIRRLLEIDGPSHLSEVEPQMFRSPLPTGEYRSKGPCDVFGPWVRWERGRVGN